MDAREEPDRSVGELRAVRSGAFTISRLHRSGAIPFRALLIGSSAIVGPNGSAADARWFAEHLADRTWLQLRRGVDLDVLWELRPVLRAIRRSTASWRLWRYDVVVILLAVAPAGALAKLRLAGIPRLITGLLGRIAAMSSVLVVGLEESGSHHSVRMTLSDPLEATGQDVPRSVRSIVVPGEPTAGAERIATALTAEAVRPDVRPQRSADPKEESDRVRAVEQLGLAAGSAGPELLRLLRAALSAFDADLAAVNIIERDRIVPIATTRTPRLTELPRRLALCTMVIASRDAVVVEDTWLEPSLADNPLIRGEVPIRFFAAYPLESVDGHRIGALCVYDSAPRSAEEVDVGLLRDLALLAEAEIARRP